MSTWDDKPNDYDHACRRIEQLENMLLYCIGWLSAEDDEFDQMLVGKIRACLAGSGDLEERIKRQRAAHAPESAGGEPSERADWDIPNRSGAGR